MTFKDSVLAASLERITIRVGAVDLAVEIVPSGFNAQIPYFVGRIDEDHYFVSDAIPERFRFPVMVHEANCLALKACDRVGHCITAYQYEMRHVSDEDIAEYRQMRLAMFEGLLAYLKKTGNSPFISEIEAVLSALQKP